MKMSINEAITVLERVKRRQNENSIKNNIIENCINLYKPLLSCGSYKDDVSTTEKINHVLKNLLLRSDEKNIDYEEIQFLIEDIEKEIVFM